MKRAVISGLLAFEMTGANAFSFILPVPLSQVSGFKAFLTVAPVL